jgi:hypothetical protein
MSLNSISQTPAKTMKHQKIRYLEKPPKKWKILLSHSRKVHTGYRESFCNATMLDVWYGPDVVVCCLSSSQWVMWDTAKLTGIATSLASSKSYLFFGKSEKFDNGAWLRLLGTELLHIR